jgi:hypothetical protein
MFSSAGAYPLALYTDTEKKSSNDRPRCLANPHPEGAESTLTGNALLWLQRQHVKSGNMEIHSLLFIISSANENSEFSPLFAM